MEMADYGSQTRSKVMIGSCAVVYTDNLSHYHDNTRFVMIYYNV